MIIIVLASAAFWLSWFFVCTKAVWTFHTPEKMKDTFGQSWNNTIQKKKTLVLVLQKKIKKKEKRITHEMFKSFDVLDCAEYAYKKKRLDDIVLVEFPI